MTNKTSIRIRTIAPGEQGICASIYTRAWNGAMPAVPRNVSVDDFASETEGELTLVGVQDETIIGYVSIWEPEWFIHQLYIDPQNQGTGVGKALLLRTEALCSPNPISLKCQVANQSAYGFYRSMGFDESAETGTSEFGDWVRLIKTLA